MGALSQASIEAVEVVERQIRMYDSSLRIFFNHDKDRFIVAQDLKACGSPNPYRPTMMDPWLAGVTEFRSRPHIHYKGLFALEFQGRSVFPSKEIILMALDQVAPRADELRKKRTIENHNYEVDRRWARDDESDSKELKSELDKYLVVDGKAVGRGLKHVVMNGESEWRKPHVEAESALDRRDDSGGSSSRKRS